MELFTRLFSSGLMGFLPVVVLLLIGGGCWIAKRGRTNVLDSAWFWAFAFSAVGLLGVWAISGKYDHRQKRVEARYNARLRIAEERALMDDGAARSQQPMTDSGQQSGYSSERRVPLEYLAGALLILSTVCAVMLWRAGRTNMPT